MTLKMHLATILAHLYCGLHWSWQVFRIEEGGRTIDIGACTPDGIVQVYTYPKWQVRAKTAGGQNG